MKAAAAGGAIIPELSLCFATFTKLFKISAFDIIDNTYFFFAFLSPLWNNSFRCHAGCDLRHPGSFQEAPMKRLLPALLSALLLAGCSSAPAADEDDGFKPVFGEDSASKEETQSDKSPEQNSEPPAFLHLGRKGWSTGRHPFLRFIRRCSLHKSGTDSVHSFRHGFPEYRRERHTGLPGIIQSCGGG